MTIAVARHDSATTMVPNSAGKFWYERKRNGRSIIPSWYKIEFRKPRSVKIESHAIPAARSEIASGIA